MVEVSIRNPARPAHASAGRCVFNELREASDDRRRGETTVLAPPLAPRRRGGEPCRCLGCQSRMRRRLPRGPDSCCASWSFHERARRAEWASTADRRLTPARLASSVCVQPFRFRACFDEQHHRAHARPRQHDGAHPHPSQPSSSPSPPTHMPRTASCKGRRHPPPSAQRGNRRRSDMSRRRDTAQARRAPNA